MVAPSAFPVDEGGMGVCAFSCYWVLDIFRYGRFPEEVSDEMIFADVGGESVDASDFVRALGRGRGKSVEVTAAEHVAFANYAGRDGDGIDAGVEFCVGR